MNLETKIDLDNNTENVSAVICGIYLEIIVPYVPLNLRGLI